MFCRRSLKKAAFRNDYCQTFSVKHLVSHPVKTTIEENSILQAVLKSLKTYPIVKNGDIVALGNVNSFISGYHPSVSELKKELSEYIKLGYFVITNEFIKVTEFGIKQLNLNS